MSGTFHSLGDAVLTVPVAGVLYLAKELDYETTTRYQLTLRATDAVTGSFADVLVNLNIEDVNDNPPRFSQHSYNATVSEGAAIGTTLLQVHATDLDVTVRQRITYFLSGNDSAPFYIEPTEGIIFVKQPLDYETQSLYRFVVKAVDGGEPSPLSATANVWVEVTDMNDHPPVFPQSTFHCTVGDSVPRGHFVTRVVASDLDPSDQPRLVYSIVAGNELQTFAIDSSTGILTISSTHHLGQKASYTLNVTVTDGVYSSHAVVHIEVRSGNRHAPRFTRTVYEVTAREDAEPGTSLVTVMATDQDRAGDFSRVSYHIPSQEAALVFAVDSDTGELFTRTHLDREARQLYEVPLVAVDGGGLLDYAAVRVTVGDVNDHAPHFLVSEFRTSLAANSSAGTTVIKVQAYDEDEGKDAKLNYLLYDTNNSSVVLDIFGISSNEGAFQFFVQAQDNGSPPQSTYVPVNLVVLPAQIPIPHFELRAYEFFLSEKEPIGTRISVLSVFSPEPVKFSFMAPAKGSEAEKYMYKFSVDDKGQIFLMSSLDREERSSYVLTVKAETKFSSLIATTEVTINVMDENDNPPVFESNPYIVSIAENVAKGSTILKVLANDADAGDNGAVTYSLGPDAGEAANVFHLDTKLGWLTTLSALDREAQAYYNFTVLATDSGAVPRSSSTYVHISVRDYNDNPPYFKRSQYETAINEDALPGTVIVTLETLDLDEDLSDPVDFYIISGDFFDQFDIKANGDVSVKKSLDREKISSYLLEVIGTDGTFIAKTNVYIDVLDANDNPPVCLKDRYTEVISESISVQTYILTIAASDADERRNAQLWYTLSGEGSEDFLIDSTSGLVKTARPLDRETRPRYQLQATVTDRGSPDWGCSSHVDIYLSDVNDNAPVFSQNVYTVSIPEDAPIGTLLTKVHATDLDLGTSRRISYSLPDTEHFEVDADTGLVRLARALDRESRGLYNVTVRATDHGSPALSTAARLEVTVLDVNDNPPEFVRARYSATVAESAPVGTEILRVLAASRDIGPNADISYSVVAGDPRLHFAIHLKTGAITVSKALDYEKIPEYELTVRATDGGVPPLSSECTVNISLLDTNDNPPVFQQSRYRTSVPEDIVIGAPIVQVCHPVPYWRYQRLSGLTQVVATDADSYPYRQLHYTIAKGDRFGQFTINPETGAITVASSLDREMVSSYQLEIQCSDSGDPPLTATAEVTVEVTDVNDNPPLFSQTNYTAVVQEGKPVGFTVLKFTVIDADATPNTTPFTFSFLSGNEKNAFRLVQQDATLRTATQFNPREHGEFVLHVQVTDSGQPPQRSAAWVTVLVIEESKHPPHVTPFSAHVNSYLDDFPGGSLGRIHATDRDPYDKLAFELASSHHHLFSLNREDGTLSALPGLDVGHYNLTISVTDGKFTTYANSLITVNLISDADLANAISIQFSDVTPEDFYLQYQKSFAKGIRNIFNVRIKDVNILSIQPSSPTAPPVKNLTLQDSWNNSQNVDVLFVIHKGTQNYFSPKTVVKKIKEKQDTIEPNIGLKITKMFESKCSEDSCVNGDCSDRLGLDKSHVTSITTETLGFVSPQHFSKMECICELGFGGPQCEVVINECGHRPCETFQVCVPEPLSYRCQCPPGKTGPECAQDKVPVCNDNTCYQETNPLSFRGRSYVRYSPLASIDRHLSVTLDLRTIQHTGNLLFVAGDHDYSILEMVNGVIQYRFECGGGEGVVRVEGKPVNDGKWHEVCVERKGRLAEVSVDRAFRSAGSAPGVHDLSALNGSDIFFGAQVRHPDDVRRGFVGCMDNLRLGGQPLAVHATPASPTATLKRLANVEYQCQSLFEAGICGSQPCQNGGSCQPSADEKTFTCQCLPRFTGPTCEVDTDPCVSSPCLHGGRCRNLPNDFHCDCPSNLSGKRCDYGRYCNPNPCHNGGICKEGSYTAICKCNGFNGDLCQFDINECLGNPCANGASCINIQGSFHCQCPSNMTGTLCTEHLFTNSITSTSWNTTPEEIIGIIVVILFIFIIAVILACCCRCRNKHRRAHQNSHNGDDLAASEFMLKNSMVDKEHVKRWSKISNLEVSSLTPPLPPRPTSYTPSTQEAINTLNKLDTVRSYGSAADDLEHLSRYTAPPAFMQNMNKASIPPSLSPPPPSDTESMIKGSWDQDLAKESIYQDKIQNTESPVVPSVLNALSPTSTVPKEHSSVQSLSSLDYDLAGYHWDCSDWAATCPRLEANITEVANSQVTESSSDSNLSQVRTTTTEEDDATVAYGFPPRGGPGFRFDSSDDALICGIEDSDAEPDTAIPPRLKTKLFASSA
ncbi:FAT1, partial [Cordylochernes scorpioides]